MRVIVGGPQTGKSTLAAKATGRTLATDSLPGWSEASQEVANAIASRTHDTLEGVATVRGLRKYMAQHPGQRMDDVEVVMLSRTYGGLSGGQERMRKGVGTVFAQIEPELRRRGATVRRG